MGRRSTVDQLPPEQRDFVINECLRYRTDRQISSDFETEFGKKLPKSSLNYWRKTTGHELVERYGVQRQMVKSFVGELESKGIDVNEDRYKQLITDLEEHLLSKTAELIAKDPLKLLEARQFDESMRIKREQIDLNRQKLDFERSKHEKEISVRVDRLAIGAESWKFILYWCNQNEPHLADGLTRNSSAILEGLEGHLENSEAA